MNALEEQLIRALAEDRVTSRTKATARRYLERREVHAAVAAARACTTASVAKAAIASIEHHRKARRAEEREREEVKAEVWVACCARSRIDHRGALACEGCHRHATSTVGMEPHHLELGAGGRRDAPEVVMVLCANCHRLGPGAAHRTPRAFVQTVVIPWLKTHGYPLPNRKEYREP